MSVVLNKTAFVAAGQQTLSLSSMFTVTPSGSNPAYLVLSGLDRNEYTAGATGKTGVLTGNGQTGGFSSIGGDLRTAGLVFTYQAASGRYYSSKYGYFDQVHYTSSASPNDVTNLSLFGTNNLSIANNYANRPDILMQADIPGYVGSVTVATQPGFSGTVPTQATPSAIAAAAQTFVGKAWNMNGCWVLASTIAAEAGASLPVNSTGCFIPGASSGEWFTAYNGPISASSNWQSQVTAGDIVVMGFSNGSGHITTVVSGSGASARVVDNITYVNSSNQILNAAHDGSSSDIVIQAPHLASQEFAGAAANSVVIYRLDTPVVTDKVASDSISVNASQGLSALFSAVDPNPSRGVTQFQVYDTLSTNSILLNGAAVSAHSAASAVSAASLSALSLRAGSAGGSDTLEVRAFNGAYWGDWQTLNVTVKPVAPSPAAAIVSITPRTLGVPTTLAGGPGPAATGAFLGPPRAAGPALAMQTADQTITAGTTLDFALPSGTFADPGRPLRYEAFQTGGANATSWLHFNGQTGVFTGSAPKQAFGTIGIEVVAIDNNQQSASETFTITSGPGSGSTPGMGALPAGVEGCRLLLPHL